MSLQEADIRVNVQFIGEGLYLKALDQTEQRKKQMSTKNTI